MNKDLLRRLGLPDDPRIDYVQSSDERDMQSHNIVMLGVEKEAVMHGHIERYTREFAKLGKKKMKSSIILTFNGWDYDPREIYQIREITNWVERMLKTVPHLFYFLSREAYSMRVVFLCLVDVMARATGEVSVSKEQSQRLIEKVSKSAVAFSKKSGDSASEQFALAESILNELGYEQTLQ